eukprot:Skav224695  [mRNA]  locus=scaffold3171:233167:238543:- [translate_table: standard]
MAYVGSQGSRETKLLTDEQVAVLNAFDLSLQDSAWHPCRITVEQKALLMTNNCTLIRRARRKWYRRLTEKCNLHDRHGGAGVEVPPVHIEAEEEESDGCTADYGLVAKMSWVSLRFGTMNMRMLSPGSWLHTLLEGVDVLCLQEVTVECSQELQTLCKDTNFQLVSPLHRGRVAAEGFDVCMIVNISTVDCLRVKSSPLPGETSRSCLQVELAVRENGSVLVVATAHLTAGTSLVSQRDLELHSVLTVLESFSEVDGCVFAGDTNMRVAESLPQGVSKPWRDAWVVDGSRKSVCGTWCPDAMSQDDPRRQDWRFDRILYWPKYASVEQALATPFRAGEYWAEIEREQARQDKLYDEAMENYYKQQPIVDPMAEIRAEQVKFEVDNGLWYPSPEHSDAEL